MQETIYEQVIPSDQQYDDGLEDAVIGEMLLDPDGMTYGLGIIRPEYFFQERWRIVVRIMLELQAQGIHPNVMTIAREIRLQKLTDSIDTDCVTQAPRDVDHSGFLPEHCKLLITDYIKRETPQAFAIAKAQAQEGDPHAFEKLSNRLASLNALLNAEDDGYFLDVDDIFEQPDPVWNIDGIAPGQSVLSLVADGGSGKTWLGLDWALLAAAGMTIGRQWWLGHAVKPGHVIYIAGEGGATMKGRIQGWLLAHGIPASAIKPYFHLMIKPLALLDEQAVSTFIGKVAKKVPENEPISFVFIDTLSKSMRGGDENANKDISAIIRACDLVKAATDATIVVMHHTGKNGDYRGASALKDDSDTLIMLKRDLANDEVEMTCLKQRGAEEFAPMRLLFQCIPAEKDSGLTIRQFVFNTAQAQQEDKGLNLTDNRKAVLVTLFANQTAMTNTELREASGMAKNGSYGDALRYLIEANLIHKMPLKQGYIITTAGVELCTENRYGQVRPVPIPYPSVSGINGTDGYGVSIDTVPSVPAPHQKREEKQPTQVANVAPKESDQPHMLPLHQKCEFDGCTKEATGYLENDPPVWAMCDEHLTMHGR